ncbi:uncharacterized protein LOC132559032 [Ylistrum balloti]|uniref:uncharacterized protein LOC132559032 n=1 Tax=Ylistrum balloti TaxID=509963 RepID=UPI002905AA1D|nr:uncharacterized protein LOC132559032 [Ylistrum balloti]
MGCTFTKVRDPRSRADDAKISEVLSKSSRSMNSERDLEYYISPATRDVIEKCQLALSKTDTENDDVISLHMYPPTNMEEYSESQSVVVESEIDIPFYRDETPDLTQDVSSSDTSTKMESSRFSSCLSSRLSNFFRGGKRSKQDLQGEVPRDDEYGSEYESGDDRSSSGWKRTPTPSRHDMKKAILQRTNSRLSDLSLMVASKRGIGEYQAMTLIHDILEKNEMSELEIDDDGRSSSSSSTDDSLFPPPFNFRIFARPNAARGTRTVARAAPNPAEIAHNIVEFEAEVEKLIDKHAVATRDFRNRQLRPGGARGPRLPSFSLQFQDPGTSTRSGTVKDNRYSKHFTNTVSRPQLTVQGLSATDDRLTQWMVSQQRRDSERR